jgi:hypothetical protein
MDEEEDTTTEEVTALNGLNVTVRSQGQNFTTLKEKQEAQQLFLAYLAETGVLINSCRLAHISFPTYQSWLDDADFVEACRIALEQHKEKIFQEVDRRGRIGFTEVLVRNGKIVTSKGKPVVVRKYSDRLLELMFNKYYSAGALQNRFGFTDGEQNGSDVYVHLPWNQLTEEEKAIIETIGQNIDTRERKKAMN